MKAFVATRKGLIVLKNQSGAWKFDKVFFDGVKASYVNVDPYTSNIWAGLNHGHWGPKLHVSTNKGKSFSEVAIPKIPQSKDGSPVALRDFWAAGFDKQGRVYIGTDPAALFYSDDLGKTWHLNEALDKMPSKDKWMAGGAEGTCLHSILINPNNDNHILIAISCAGVLESMDRGKTWRYSNKGLKAEFLPEKDAEVGQDPHLIDRSASNPNIVWQQNHCGIFKSEDSGKTWQDLSKAKGLKSAFGWVIAVDEKDANTAYTIPAHSDVVRVPVKKALVVQKTTNGGKSWQTMTQGLPQKFSYDIVYRHGLSLRKNHLIFGTTTGHLYGSKNNGKNWKLLFSNLAPIFSVKLMD